MRCPLHSQRGRTHCPQSLQADPTEWRTAIVSRFRPTPKRARYTILLHGPACMEWHVSDDFDARRLREQRRYCQITECGKTPLAGRAALPHFGHSFLCKASQFLQLAAGPEDGPAVRFRTGAAPIARCGLRGVYDFRDISPHSGCGFEPVEDAVNAGVRRPIPFERRHLCRIEQGSEDLLGDGVRCRGFRTVKG